MELKRKNKIFALFCCLVVGGGIATYALPRILWSIRQSAYGNFTLSFYGKIVDESKSPMADVEVRMQLFYSDQVKIPVPFSGSEKLRFFIVTTDGRGEFGLLEQSGYSISIVGIKKNGRELEIQQPNQTFTFVYNSPNSVALFPDKPSKRKTFIMKRLD